MLASRSSYILFHILIPLQFAAFASEGSAAAGSDAGRANNSSPFFYFLPKLRNGQNHAGCHHPHYLIRITSRTSFHGLSPMMIYRTNLML